MAKRKPPRRTAATSDRYKLYELAVQSPKADCLFIDQVWLEMRGREARTLREDFCGTSLLAIEWVRRHGRNTAIGVDIDPAVLAVARQRVLKRLKPMQRHRLRLIAGDVTKVETPRVDTVVAPNFSYWIFKTRARMRAYFRAVRRALVDDGIFILDAYGGHGAYQPQRERRQEDGFTYVWDQAHYNPVTGDVVNHIHFEFPDGTRMKKAFTYEWRLWSLPELRELLREAGFKEVIVYWEGTDEERNEGNGIFTPTVVGEACPGWVSYLVAVRSLAH